MKIAFRTDASLAIGTGHATRCLTLADALAERGAQSVFICREHPGHVIEAIARRGYAIHVLPRADSSAPPPDAVTVGDHRCWLGVPWCTDAAQTRAAVEGSDLDWLVVDHYPLDARWEAELRPVCRRLMAIDDLADRAHDCDLLLDQTFGRDEADYSALVPEGCLLLTGSRYALLRPEFAAHREYSRKRREKAEISRILVFMGGVDPHNATGRILSAIDESSLPGDVRLTIVMGRNAPCLPAVREQAISLRWPAEVLVDVQEMAKLMADSDLAVGAAGTASWERCALGLPCITFEMADNQALIGRNLGLAGAHWFMGRIELLSPPEFGAVLRHALIDPFAISAMQRAASGVCDGRGASRVAAAMVGGGGARVRRATLDDAGMLHAWRNHPAVRATSFDQSEIDFDRHLEWLTRCLAEDSRILLVVEFRGKPGACVRFDVAQDVAEVSIYLNPALIGRGLGRTALQAAIHWLTKNAPATRRLRAFVRQGNTASDRLFLDSGFVRSYSCFEKTL